MIIFAREPLPPYEPQHKFNLHIRQANILLHVSEIEASQVVLKHPPVNTGELRDTGSIPGLGRFRRKAWKPTLVILPGISWTEDPDVIQSIGSQRVGHDSSDLACTHTYIINCISLRKAEV